MALSVPKGNPFNKHALQENYDNGFNNAIMNACNIVDLDKEAMIKKCKELEIKMKSRPSEKELIKALIKNLSK